MLKPAAYISCFLPALVWWTGEIETFAEMDILTHKWNRFCHHCQSCTTCPTYLDLESSFMICETVSQKWGLLNLSLKSSSSPFLEINKCSTHSILCLDWFDHFCNCTIPRCFFVLFCFIFLVLQNILQRCSSLLVFCLLFFFSCQILFHFVGNCGRYLMQLLCHSELRHWF